MIALNLGIMALMYIAVAIVISKLQAMKLFPRWHLDKAIMQLFLRRPMAKAPASQPSLDGKLLDWGGGDVMTVRDLLSGGAAILGRSGSGKTSGSGKHMGEAVVRQHSGGLILGSKPEDAGMWQDIFARCGRKDDLIVFEPGGPLRFNFLDYIRHLGGDTREVTKTLTTIAETLRGSDNKGGENADFWEAETERMIFNAVELLIAGTGSVSAPTLQRFITTAAYNTEQLGSEEWKADFHNQVIKEGWHKKKTETKQNDFDLAMTYWLREFPRMSDKTRSSIQTSVMGLLHVFNTGQVRELCSTTTNISPDEMLKGKWILVNMPPSNYGDSGNFVNAGWKYLTQKMVMRRHPQDGDPINVIWMDEAQNFITSTDSWYLAECRSHRGCMVALTQSLHSVYSKLSGDKGFHQAMSLLANFGTKIFHALGSAQDAEFASKLLGRTLQTFIGGSMPPEEDIFSSMLGRNKFTANFSEHYEPTVEPGVFINNMRTGGAPEYLVDGIVVRSGQPFSDGNNWKWVTFNQR